MADLEQQITDLWERRAELEPGDVDARRLVHEAIELLDSGAGRVAEFAPDGSVVVHAWLKQAILLLFTFATMETIELGPFEYADKIPLKRNYERLRVRVVPGASARWGSFLAPGVILM